MEYIIIHFYTLTFVVFEISAVLSFQFSAKIKFTFAVQCLFFINNQAANKMSIFFALQISTIVSPVAKWLRSKEVKLKLIPKT